MGMEITTLHICNTLASVICIHIFFPTFFRMTKVQPLFRFVVMLHLFMAACFCYAVNSRFSSSSETDVEEVLKRLNKPPVKSIKSPDGDIIDCVNIYHQPAFDHPLLKKHTIQMKPDYLPNSINVEGIKVSSMMNASKYEPSFTQLWHSNGKCPKGTIPIRRTKKEDLLRASFSVSCAKKKPLSIARHYIIDNELDDVQGQLEYASAYILGNGNLYGTKATLNTWNPKVDRDDEHSMAQVWIVGCFSNANAVEDVNTMEAGWHVYPGLYGDANTRLFIYWTRDGSKTTGCFNLQCSGFIQTNNKIALGGSVVKGGDNWWMQVDGETVGYWPKSLFSHLCESASLIEWGGEVANFSPDHHTTTQMGSGQLPKQGFRKASYIRNIQTVDESNYLRSPDNLNTATDDSCSYDISKHFKNDDYWGTHIFYGGTFQNIICH
ncbi:hypothetical protein M8C21_015445 [Ambrosia artemisiifolia]|uniref:Neprosin PEP catalytic domain-containing protein n=1 Tax=Ambrosia artemisiifolia TaxID=4212 RepID=A0AAD5G143_AMBAR|nr:hypothetical protein M8C21_015445 [Ambrosia artemisiifolia]